ncbi:hypothetical protein Tco_1081334 [Tanacetum coccineum]|uniref:Uncharacterized protein n=1 Tax=Tanacetum coccineum TaxID=301880 RepID=A0ABQ5HYK2_9ASTR
MKEIHYRKPLAKAMEVASLTLKLIQGCQYKIHFIQFPYEIKDLQNEIAMCIQLLDRRVKLSVLRDIQVLLNLEAKLNDQTLRMSIRNFLVKKARVYSKGFEFKGTRLLLYRFKREYACAYSSDFQQHKDEQIRTIKEEFGGNDDEYDDVAALQRKMQNAGKPPNFHKHASRELRWENAFKKMSVGNFRGYPSCSVPAPPAFDAQAWVNTSGDPQKTVYGFGVTKEA